FSTVVFTLFFVTLCCIISNWSLVCRCCDCSCTMSSLFCMAGTVFNVLFILISIQLLSYTFSYYIYRHILLSVKLLRKVFHVSVPSNLYNLYFCICNNVAISTSMLAASLFSR